MAQVTNAWTSKYKIKHIFVVDDELYKDDIARRVLMMASPSKVNTSVYSTDQMAGILQQTSILSSDSKAAVLVKVLKMRKVVFQSWKDYKSFDFGKCFLRNWKK